MPRRIAGKGDSKPKINCRLPRTLYLSDMHFTSIRFLANFSALIFLLTSCISVNKMGRDLSYNNYYSHELRKNKTSEQHIDAVLRGSMKAYNLMALSRMLGGLIAQYEATDSLEYLDAGYDLCLRAIERSQVSKDIEGNRSPFLDNYRSWINLNPNEDEHVNGGGHLQEVPLFESYLFRYMAKLLYETKRISPPDRTPKIRTQYGAVLHFVSKNGWEKWYMRGEAKNSCYTYLFRSRTHMTSHWALVALFMSRMDTDKEKVVQYNTFVDLYNKQLRENLFTKANGAYIWNMTWSNPWPSGLNCNPAALNPIIQDGSHGDHVITYVVESYEMQRYWNEEDIKRFSKTLRFLLFDEQSDMFYADLSGTVEDKFKSGMEYADGFIKLGRYDKKVLQCFEKARLKNEHEFYFDDIQYVAEFNLAKRYLKK